ncbi:2970_t:CDS:2, partial [Cetraspora pellucida]
VDSDDNLPLEDEILLNKLNQEIHNVRTQEVISITDSDDELPSKDKILFKKINQGNHYVGTPEVILITDSDNKLVQQINHLVFGYYEIKGYIIILEHLMKNTKVWKPKVGQKFIEEVIIPELGVRFIIEDLGVSDYNTAVKIICESIKYSNQHFFGNCNNECFDEKIYFISYNCVIKICKKKRTFDGEAYRFRMFAYSTVIQHEPL